LKLAKESVQEERGKKGHWRPWLEGRFTNRLPLSTAELYIRLADHEEFLFGKMQQVSDRRMSLRAAMKLIPLTPDGLKRQAAAQERAAKKKETEKAAARVATVADLSTEERVGDLAVDEFLLARGDVDVVEIVMGLTTTLDRDQLIALVDRLNEWLEENKPEAEAEEPAPEPVAPAPPKTVAEMQRNSILSRPGVHPHPRT
jgi:hypothetical protein